MDPRTFTARFSDGTTAASQSANVRFSARGLEITPQNGGVPLVWPYGALSTSEPLGRHAIEALVSYRYQPGASLFVAEPAFARALAEAAPHLTAKAERWRQARPWLWIGAGVALVVAAVGFFHLSPARSIASLLPESTRDYMGRQVVSQMTAGRKQCVAPAGRAALDKLFARLSQAAGQPEGFEVTVVDWGLVNAFAAPGETIVVTRGLIDSAQTADELAGVVAHEMGHGLALHPETGIVRSLGLSAVTQLLFGGGNLTGLGVALTQLAYTRDAEREADQLALDLLRKAEVSPDGLAAFFRRIGGDKPNKPASSNIGALDVLRTHPQTAERIETVERVERYPSQPALEDGDWRALKGICGEKKD